MTTEIETIDQPVIPADEGTAPVEAPIAPVVEVPEQTYHYQPTDESGRPLGGKQVIKYKTPDELTQKLTEQNVLLVRKLREETKNNRLGITTKFDIPEDAERFDTPVDFTPRQLTADERVKLSRDLLNPEKFDEASSALFEATVGTTPLTLRKTLNALQVSNLRLLAKAESESFLRSTPSYYACQENFETITNWMLKENLAPVHSNFQLAFDKLTAAGLLLEAPIVREEAPPPAPQAETITEPTPANTLPAQDESSRITQTEPAQPKRPVATIPSGLNRSTTSESGTPPTKAYTLAEINRMDGETYKQKLLHEKGFAALAEQLFQEQAASRKR